MQEKDKAVFQNLPREKYDQMRQNLIAMVLATDVASHFSDLSTIKKKLEATGNNITIDHTTKTACMNCVIHACDISYPLKKQEFSLRWAKLLAEEFFIQVKNFWLYLVFNRFDKGR